MHKYGLDPLDFQILLLKTYRMKTKNFVQLIGYLGNDPEIHMTTTGKTMGRLRLATDFYRKQEDGKTHRKTTWHDVKAWNKLAESLPGQFIKGSHVLVEGVIEYRTFLDPSGHKRFVTEIKAISILNLDR